MTGPQDWVTTAGLIAATAGGLIACAGATKRVCCAGGWESVALRGGTVAATLLSAAVLGWRFVTMHHGWMPLHSHVDGLSLLAALLGVLILYLHTTRRLPGLALFGVPMLTLVTLWGVCASWWTMKPFVEIRSVWMTVHLLSVYVGMLAVAAAAAAGGLWLYVDRQLRSKDHRAQRLARLGPVADLESVERTITTAASAGFVLLSLALVTGVVILSEPGVSEAGWWYTPKVVMAAAVWGIFALVMHVRFVPTFRGRRAAWLSIAGFVLLVAVIGAAVGVAKPAPSAPPPATAATTTAGGG